MNTMNERFECSPNEVKVMDSVRLKETFAITDLFQKGTIQFVYSHYDRMIVGGAIPDAKGLELTTYLQLKSDYFLERRELGVINVAGKGTVEVEGHGFELEKLDCLYVGKGAQKITFISADQNAPAKFFLLSAPAHHNYPSQLMKKDQATPAAMGSPATSNQRTIYKYIHLDGIRSCQLVMGLTVLNEGSVWNTMPAHTHNRRMEVYFYFDVPDNQRVFHLMGQPQETRHIVMKNEWGVISPPWSIHAGCGTGNYSFIWGMAGENQSFADMDFVDMNSLQ